MASQNFAALCTEINDAKQEIKQDEEGSPFHFLDDFYRGLDSFLLDVLDSLEDICTNEDLRPGGKPEETKGHVYDELEQVRQIRETLYSNRIPVELYFLLEDIKRDLSIELAIGLESENEFLIHKINNRFRMLQMITFWGTSGQEETKSHIIKFPRSEVKHPLSYSLLAHECFHTKERLVEDVAEKLCELEDEVPEQKREEICVDLLSLNYLGPAYGLAIAKIPDKIGRHESGVHPSHESRYKYILQYLEHIEEASTSDEKTEGSELIQQTLGVQANYHPVYQDAQAKVAQAIKERRNDGGENTQIQNFEELQNYIREKFSEEGIPTYIEERSKTKYYLGMPNASIDVVAQKLNSFLLKNDGDEIALPVKPILFFNMLLAVDDYETKTLDTVALSSFKKWYVTRRTKEVKEESFG